MLKFFGFIRMIHAKNRKLFYKFVLLLAIIIMISFYYVFIEQSLLSVIVGFVTIYLTAKELDIPKFIELYSVFKNRERKLSEILKYYSKEKILEKGEIPLFTGELYRDIVEKLSQNLIEFGGRKYPYVLIVEPIEHIDGREVEVYSLNNEIVVDISVAPGIENLREVFEASSRYQTLNCIFSEFYLGNSVDLRLDGVALKGDKIIFYSSPIIFKLIVYTHYFPDIQLHTGIKLRDYFLKYVLLSYDLITKMKSSQEEDKVNNYLQLMRSLQYANSQGFGMLVLTSDRKFVFVKRGAKLITDEGRVGVVSGFFDFETYILAVSRGLSPNFSLFIEQELFEESELGLSKKRKYDYYFLGILKDLAKNGTNEFLFIVELDMSSKEIADIFRKFKARKESKDLYFLDPKDFGLDPNKNAIDLATELAEQIEKTFIDGRRYLVATNTEGKRIKIKLEEFNAQSVGILYALRQIRHHRS